MLQTTHGLWEMWTNYRSLPAYYPISHTSWWIDYQLFGLDLRFYHIENIAMHALSAVLIWLILQNLNAPAPWLAAALWAVHPIHVESVAWITERKNTLSVMFYLLSFWCYMRASGLRQRDVRQDILGSHPQDNPKPPIWRKLNKRWYSASLLLFAIALPAKTPVVTLPAAVLLAWWYRNGDETDFWRTTFRRELLRMVPFFALGLCMGCATVWIEQHHSGAKGPLFDFTPMQRFVLIGRSFWFYIWKVYWPTQFNFVYPRWHILTGLTYQWLFPLTALALIGALLMLRRRLGRGPATAIMFYAGTALPALGIAPIYFHRYSLASDHFAYLCNIGLTCIAAWIIVHLLRRSRPAVYALAAAALIILSVQTIRQTGLYANNLTMWQDVLAKNPDSWMAHGNLAGRLDQAGRPEEAEAHFKRALELDPESVEAVLPYAVFLAKHQRIDEAIPLFERALQIAPDYLNAYSFYAKAFVQAGRTADAIKIYQRGLARAGNFEAGHIELGDVYASIGKTADAAAEYRTAIQVEPKSVVARVNLANLFLKSGQVEPAIQLLSEAATISDDNADVHNRYGLLLLQLGQYPAAVEQFQRMVELTKGKPGAHIAYHNLGTALEGAGRNSEAVLNYQRALAINPDFAPARRNLERALAKPQ